MQGELFQRAVQAARSGDKAGAQQLLRQVLREDPKNVSAWLWMSGVVEELHQQKDCLERALAIDPTCKPAREGLEILKLRETLQAVTQQTAAPSETQVNKLGDYLVEHGFISRDQLESALTFQRNHTDYQGRRQRLGDILVHHGVLTPQVLARALVVQQQQKLTRLDGQRPEHLGEYLVFEGLLTSEQLATVLEQQAQLRQQGKAAMLGELLISSGYVSPEALEQMLEQQRLDFFSRFGD